jgi:hypothetical protein
MITSVTIFVGFLTFSVLTTGKIDEGVKLDGSVG